MQIVKNIGNYEMARLQATYELADGEGDTREAMADLFREGTERFGGFFHQVLRQAILYRDEEVEDVVENVWETGRLPITHDKVRLITKRQVQRVLDALEKWRCRGVCGELIFDRDQWEFLGAEWVQYF